MTQFRKGDVVTIEATIASDYVHDGSIKIMIDPHHDIFVKQSDLTMLRSEIRVGDSIEWVVGEKTYRGEVLAVADDHAWVHMGGGEYATVWLKNARRIDPEPAQSEAEAA